MLTYILPYNLSQEIDLYFIYTGRIKLYISKDSLKRPEAHAISW